MSGSAGMSAWHHDHHPHRLSHPYHHPSSPSSSNIHHHYVVIVIIIVIMSSSCHYHVMIMASLSCHHDAINIIVNIVFIFAVIIMGPRLLRPHLPPPPVERNPGFMCRESRDAVRAGKQSLGLHYYVTVSQVHFTHGDSQKEQTV